MIEDIVRRTFYPTEVPLLGRAWILVLKYYCTPWLCVLRDFPRIAVHLVLRCILLFRYLLGLLWTVEVPQPFRGLTYNSSKGYRVSPYSPFIPLLASLETFKLFFSHCWTVFTLFRDEAFGSSDGTMLTPLIAPLIVKRLNVLPLLLSPCSIMICWTFWALLSPVFWDHQPSPPY